MPDGKKVLPRVVSADYAGQRLDNYLLREWCGVPRSLVYRLIRSGQVRVNSGRVRPDCRLQTGDRLRLPESVRLPVREASKPPPLTMPVLYEDAVLLAVDKPAGLAVHGGSGLSHGVIERLRRPLAAGAFLELVHRLDRETSGVLLLAKKRAALLALQKQWRARRVHKHYTALVFGNWQAARHRRIDLPLKRIGGDKGQRHVIVDEAGKSAGTRTKLIARQRGGALLDAVIQTGRTHQLRVHFAAADIPIVGDKKYGNFAANRTAAAAGFHRMFLHAAQLVFTHPQSGEAITVTAALPAAFTEAADWLQQQPAV